jgi:hypothetical protein
MHITIEQTGGLFQDLFSVPLQFNWDTGIGPEDASRYTLNVQPVIPFSLSRDWNLITRTMTSKLFMINSIHGLITVSSKIDILNFPDFIPETNLSGDPVRLKKIIGKLSRASFERRLKGLVH